MCISGSLFVLGKQVFVVTNTHSIVSLVIVAVWYFDVLRLSLCLELCGGCQRFFQWPTCMPAVLIFMVSTLLMLMMMLMSFVT